MADNLDKLIHALKLSKTKVRNIKKNMFFVVGTVALILAGVLTKNVNLDSGILIHELSLLLVILNTIRLIKFKTSQFHKSSTQLKNEKAFSKTKVCVECQKMIIEVSLKQETIFKLKQGKSINYDHYLQSFYADTKLEQLRFQKT